MKTFKLLTFLLVITSGVILTGCSSARYNTVEVQQKEVVKIKVPEFLLVSCKPNPPMSVDAYVALESVEREVYLTGYIQDLYVVLSKCDNAMGKIREFNRDE